MENEDKTKEQLIAELAGLRKRIAELEKSEIQRRQVEEDLRNSQEWYRTLYGENPSMYFTVGADGKVLSINSSGAEQLGYMPQELVGQSILGIIYEEDKQVILQQIAECLKHPGHIVTRELRKVRKDGTVLWVKEVARAVRVPAGNEIILIICEDITESKRTEQALAESEARYRILVESARDVIFIISLDGTITYLNPAFEKLNGLSRARWLGKNFQLLVHPDDLPVARDIYRRILSGEVPPSFELRVLSRTRDYVPVEITVAPQIRDGKIIGGLGIARDITERKRAEQALRSSEAKYRILVEQSLVGIYITQDEKILYVNPKLAEMLGYTQDEIITSKSVSDLIVEEYRDRAIEYIRKRLRGEAKSIHHTFRGKRKDGTLIDFEVYGTRIELNGKSAVMGVAIDITERKRAEEDLRKARDELEIRVQERTAELARANEALQAEIIERKRTEKQLKESEERYKNIVELTTDIIYISDIEGNQIFMNSAGYRILETTPEEVIGKPWTKWIHPDDRERTVKKFRDIIEQGIDIFDFENRYVSKRGRVIDIFHNVRVLRGREGNIIGTQGIARDITERKRAEEHIRFQNLILYQVNDAVIATDNNQRIIYWNNGAERLYNFKSEEVLGRPLREVIKYRWLKPEDEQAAYDSLEATGSWRGENIQAKKSGEIIYVEASIRTLKDEKGAAIGFIAVMRDITERKQIEQRLRLLSGAVEEAPDGIQIVDLDGRIIFSNKAVEKIFGFSPEELKGKHINVMSVDPEFTSKVMLPSIKETGRWVGEVLVKRKDGSTFPIWLNTCMISDEKGEPLAIVGIIRDITERKRAEEDLRKSEERYRHLVETSFIGIWTIDANGKTNYVNKRAAEMLGYTVEEMLGKSPLDFVYPVDIPLAKRGLEMQREEVREEFDFRLCRKDESEIWVHAANAPMFNEHGEYLGAVAMFINITERKRTERLLQESEQRYRNLIELTTDIIYLSDRGGKQVFVNDACYRLLEARPEEVIGHTWEKWIYPADRERTSKRFREMIEQGKDLFDFENRFVSKSGRIIYLLHNVRLLRSENGRITGTQGIARDITERKRIEEERERWTAELTRSNVELEQFAYIVSHDLQEPLRMISGFTQLLAKRYRGRLDKDADEFIAFIVDGVTRMQRMIEDLLAYSRVGTRGKPFEPTDLEVVLNQALTNLKVAIEQNKAVITHDPLPTIMADDTQMAQLFQNLLANAIKFRRREEPPHIHIYAQRKGNEWIFSVKDNGIGIAPEFMGHLFQIFQRAHAASEYPGTGIGLAICKRIVERHGGRIWAESKPGKGSTFYFTIPAR